MYYGSGLQHKYYMIAVRYCFPHSLCRSYFNFIRFVSILTTVHNNAMTRIQQRFESNNRKIRHRPRTNHRCTLIIQLNLIGRPSQGAALELQFPHNNYCYIVARGILGIDEAPSRLNRVGQQINSTAVVVTTILVVAIMRTTIFFFLY